jgi:hypothetical protein
MGRYDGAKRRNVVKSPKKRMAVRMRAERTTVPREGEVALVRAAWIV